MSIGFPLVSLGRLVRFGNGSDYKDVEVSDGGYPVYGSGGAFRRASRYLYEGESVLFGRKGTIDRPLYVSGRFWTVDTMYYTVPSPRIVPKFLYYAATTIPFEYYATNTAVPSMTQADLSGHRIPLPELDEQRAIADYLDQETAQIDALVAKQEELLRFLAERKRSVLDHVLAGVNGARRRLRWLYRPSNQANHPDEEVLSVYREHGVIPKASRTDNFNKTPENVDRYLLVRPDDLVVNKMKAWQGSLGISSHRGIVSGDYEVLRPTTLDLDPEYAHFRLRSPELVLEYRLRSRGVRPSQWRLYWQELGDIEVVVPSLADQQIAASRIKAETAQIDNLIAKAEEHIALAKERRSALITAAVTGQFDVRTAKKGARV